MKINVRYGKRRYIVDILSTDTIYKVKQKIQRIAHVTELVTSIMSEVVPRSTLFFAGTSLHDDMIVNDIGIVSGSTLLYKYIETEKSRLKVCVKFLKKTIELGKDSDISLMTIGDIRVLLQNQIGIPVSMFYLVHPVNVTRELFDIHDLTYYDIHKGETLVLHLWKGTRRVVMNAMNSDISGTMSHLPDFYENPSLNRYLLRVALFIAAHFDHMKLAAQVLLQGIRCEEPVGEHSSRQWCCTKSHPDVFKAPIHQAAHQGSFECLKMFIRHSPSSLICRDGNRLTPGNYAATNKNIKCWKLIVASQFMHSRICGFSLQSHLRIMKWCSAAKERVNYFKGDAKKSILLHSTVGRSNNTYLGNSLYVDGFNHEKAHYRDSRTPRHKTVTSTRKLSKLKQADITSDEISTAFATRNHSKLKSEGIKPNNTTTKLASQLGQNTEEENPKQEVTPKLLKRDLEKKVNLKKGLQNEYGNAELPQTAIKPSKKKKLKKTTKTKKVSPTPRTTPQNKFNSNVNEITKTMKLDEEIIINSIRLRDEDAQRKTWRPRSTNLLFGSETTSVIGPDRSGFTPLFLRFHKDLPSQTSSLIFQATGMQPRDLACACLQLGEKFCRKPWMQQFTIAVNSSTNRVKRGCSRSEDI